jgi:hypothetical protein
MARGDLAIGLVDFIQLGLPLYAPRVPTTGAHWQSSRGTCTQTHLDGFLQSRSCSLPLHAMPRRETRQVVLLFFGIVVGHGGVEPDTGVALGAVSSGKGDVQALGGLSQGSHATPGQESRQAGVSFFRDRRRTWRCRAKRGRSARHGRRWKGRCSGTRRPEPGSARRRSATQPAWP